MGVGALVLRLQTLDLEIDWLTRTIVTPPERAAHDAAQQVVADIDAALYRIAQTRAQAETEVAQAEAAAAGIDQHAARLHKQLRNVVVVREAEALQHELATLAQRRSELDDVGLVALELLDELDSEQVALEMQAPGERDVRAHTGAVLEQARAELTARQNECRLERERVLGELSPDVVTRYEELRRHLGGIGAAALEGARCGGCRLDLARGEVEALRSAPADELVDCPSCGRILVR